MSLADAAVESTVHHVTDGVAALDYLGARPSSPSNPDARRPDVVLLDLNLPRLNGHEVLERIRGDDRLQTIPVVVLSTSSDPDDCAQAYRNRANSFVSKPADFTSFHRMIGDLAQYWGTWNQIPEPSTDDVPA